MGPQSNDFLTAFSRDEKFFLSLPFLWSVEFFAISPSSINKVLQEVDSGWSAKFDPKDYTKNGGLLIAQEVVLPNETSSFIAFNSGSSGMGGFMPGYGVDSRSDFLNRTVTLTMFETKDDLEHNFFRPWMMAVGINGLVGSSLKGKLVVTQYDNRGKPRKGMVFNNIFPTNVEGISLNQTDSDFTMKAVTFAYTDYSPR